MEQAANTVTLRGTVSGLPQFSHENHGRRFSRFYLAVPRLSGAVDTLPVIAQEGALADLSLAPGVWVEVTGQIRSHNLRTDGRRHLLIFVFAGSVVCQPGQPVNQVVLEGIVCRSPTYRRTPLGRQICDVMLAVPRAFHRVDYLPCILWGKQAQQGAQCQPRDVLQIQGRLQSRLYTKLTPEGSQERTAYEISALSAQILRQPRQVTG